MHGHTCTNGYFTSNDNDKMMYDMKGDYVMAQNKHDQEQIKMFVQSLVKISL